MGIYLPFNPLINNIMSGHSKWATTKRQKAVTDAKKSQNFTKLTNLITIAARSGANPETNFKLRMAIDKARAQSLPKDNIERAIKKGSGELSGENLEEIIYEGFGPEKSAVLVECVTDNKNRTLGNIKHLFNEYGGNLGSSGSVLWQFKRSGFIILDQAKLSEAEQLEIIEAGAEDLQDKNDQIYIYTKPENLEKVKIALKNFPIKEACLTWLPKEKIKVNNPEKLEEFFEKLDGLDEVNDIYSNVE